MTNNDSDDECVVTPLSMALNEMNTLITDYEKALVAEFRVSADIVLDERHTLTYRRHKNVRGLFITDRDAGGTPQPLCQFSLKTRLVAIDRLADLREALVVANNDTVDRVRHAIEVIHRLPRASKT